MSKSLSQLEVVIDTMKLAFEDNIMIVNHFMIIFIEQGWTGMPGMKKSATIFKD